jgi:hypothetical protein
MNPAYGGGVGVGGGGAQGAVVPAAGTAPPQPMMRPPSSGPGYGMPPKQQQPLPPPQQQQQQQQRGFAPGPTGYVPTAGPPAAPAMMPPGVHSSCHGDMERAPRVKSLHRPIVVCLNPLNQTVTTALMSVVYHLCVSCHSPALSVQTGSGMNYCM